MAQRYGDYHDRRAAFLTQHGKERVVAPLLETGLGCIIEHVTGFDTDQLGTFTREIIRPSSQLHTARLKARKGMELANLSLGLASEGSFGPDPLTKMIPWDIEQLIWIDDESGIEIIGIAQGPAHNGHLLCQHWEEIVTFAERAGFPEQQLVLRPNEQDDPHVRKGIANWSELKKSFIECLAESNCRQVFVELDLRAFANPTRMKYIEQATNDLVQKIQSKCPACEAPGFWISERKAGLPCLACGLPTPTHQLEIWKCKKCIHTSTRPRTDITYEDPARCPYCNP